MARLRLLVWSSNWSIWSKSHFCASDEVEEDEEDVFVVSWTQTKEGFLRTRAFMSPSRSVSVWNSLEAFLRRCGLFFSGIKDERPSDCLGEETALAKKEGGDEEDDIWSNDESDESEDESAEAEAKAPLGGMSLAVVVDEEEAKGSASKSMLEWKTMTLRTPLINCNSTTKSCPIFINNPRAFPSSSRFPSPLIPRYDEVDEDLFMGPFESCRLAKDTYGDAINVEVEGKMDLRTKVDEEEDERRDWR